VVEGRHNLEKAMDVVDRQPCLGEIGRALEDVHRPWQLRVAVARKWSEEAVEVEDRRLVVGSGTLAQGWKGLGGKKKEEEKKKERKKEEGKKKERGRKEERRKERRKRERKKGKKERKKKEGKKERKEERRKKERNK
jgi:hypothetical protein